MNTHSLHVRFPGAFGTQLSARLDLPPAPRAFAILAHCFKSYISLDDADHLLTRKEDAQYVAAVLAAWAGRYLAEPSMTEGGTDTGPSPYDLLLAALGARTSMTVRLYADLKRLPLERVTVRLKHDKIHARDCIECETREGRIDRIEREIDLQGSLDDAQRAKLLEIASKCPVHRTLNSEVWIPTRLATTPDATAGKTR